MMKFVAAASIAGFAFLGVATMSAAAQRYGDDRRDRDRLTLVCWGEGRKPSTDISSGYAWDSNRRKFVPQTYLQSTTRQFDSEVQVELQGDWGRIHLTGPLIPPIHSGGRDGWWDLEDVRFGPDVITARYRMNGLNKPRVTIDRRSGRISINGIEQFRGECDQGDWGQRGNRF